MNSKPLIAFLAVLSSSGCIIVDHGGGGTKPAAPGDVTFSWSFAGATCSDVPQVAKVVVNVPGETLLNNGVFPCIADNYPGITLHNFRGGSYTFTLQALGYGDEVLYTASGPFTVNGNTRVDVDLTPAGGPNSFSYLTWRFPPNAATSNPDCASAGVATVDVAIDGVLVPAPYRCIDGIAAPGVKTPFVAAGTHTIDIQGLRDDGYLLYRFTGSLQTQAAAPVSSDYLLPWAVGGVELRWQFTDGSLGVSCASGGISDVWVNLQDSAGHLLYGADGDRQACNQASVPYNFITPGTYKVLIKAGGAGSSLYLSNSTTPPLVTIAAGTFADPGAPTTVQLFRVQ